MTKRIKKYFSAFLAAALVFTAVPVPDGKTEAAEQSDLIAAYAFETADIQDRVIADTTGNGNDASLKGNGASIANGMLTLPGGGAGSDAAYVELPGNMFEGQDTLTITTWLKNETGSNNYSAMYFGTTTKHIGGGTANMPLHYWILNPAQPKGYFKSVVTDGSDADGPYNTETAVSTTKTSADWGMYTTVITAGEIVGYYNGTEVSRASKTMKTSEFGTGLVAFIGRSSYNDMFYKGGVYGVRIYKTALTQEEITAEYNNDKLAMDRDQTDLGDLSQVTEDLSLPAAGSNGSVITWSSSNPSVVAADGKVTRDPNEDKTAVLTAVFTLNGTSLEKEFTVTVANRSVANLFKDLTIEAAVMESDASLPAALDAEHAITWSSSNPSVLAIQKNGTQVRAVVTRPAMGEEDVNLILTAEAAGIKKEFPVTVRAEDYGYLLAYTNSTESTALGSSLHLAYSLDGLDYEALNSNTGICFANNAGGSKNSSPNGLKNMYIFRKADGSYGMAATNVGTQKYIYFFDSDNLVDFTNERKLEVNANVTGGLFVEQCRVKEDSAVYRVCWTDGTKQYSALTEDFVSVISQGEDTYTEPDKTVVGILPEGAQVCSIFGASKAEYQFVTGKLGVVTNTGMKPVSVNVPQNGSLSNVLPDKVTAEYSDGSTADMAVNWNAEELAAINTAVAGTYEVSGTVKQTQYANPFIEQRADPCILKGNDGYYYFTASYPMCGSSDKNGYDKVVLRQSETIEGLADAQEITIWDCDDTSDEFRYVWAPEIRLVDGKYYVFYTSSTSASSVWGIRPHVLKCTNPSDIMNPSSWQAMGQMQAASGDTQAFSNFSLDMTVFENQGRWYVAWAQTDGFSSIFIAEIDKDEPWKCISKCVKISVPEFSWERISENVDEGPSVIKNNGKIYLAFSASGTGPEYCVGLLSIGEDDNLLDAASWKKQAYPVLTSSDVPGEYGPGHNSFTVDEEGNAVFVYHARGEACYTDQCQWANQGPLYDPCRDARLKRVHWAADGTPILKMSYDEELAAENRTVTATVVITAENPGTSGGNPNPGQDTDTNPGGSGGTNPGQDTGTTPGTSGGNTNPGQDPGTNPNQNPAGDTPAAVSGVKVNITRAALGVKEKLTLKANVMPADAAGAKISFKSSKPKVASVSAKGVVTAKKKGTTTITAAIGDKRATCKITVKAAPKKITLNAKSKNLKKKRTFQIKVKLPKGSASYKIRYSSSNKKVASVSASGKVKALKKGNAVITVKTFNGKTAKIKITVK